MKSIEQKILKKGILTMLFAIGAEALVYAFYCLFQEGWGLWIWFNVFLFISHTAGLLLIRKSSYERLKALMPVYLFFLFLIISPEIYFYFRLEQLAWILWFVPISPLGVIIFFPSRQGITGGFVALVAIAIIFLLKSFSSIGLTSAEPMTEKQQEMMNLFAILFALINSSIPIYAHLQLIRLRDENTNGGDNEKKLSNEDIAKYNLLYKNITRQFEEKKIYKDPKLTVPKLAHILNTNTNYIYQAIQLNTQMNFNTFVNSYRINMIKKMIEDGWAEEYTIQYIYSSAGFTNQATFNKIFKSFEGKTPTDYIELHRKNAEN